jgi:hypothetical protein
MVTKLAEKDSFTERWRDHRGNGSMRLRHARSIFSKGHAPWMLLVAFLLTARNSCAYNAGSSWRNFEVFAALTGDGTVKTWGWRNYHPVPSDLGGDVKVIYSTGSAFAALKGDGTVKAWGYCGTSCVPAPAGLSSVKVIYSIANAFAALKEDGTVTTWGENGRGGNVPSDLDLTDVYIVAGSDLYDSDSSSPQDVYMKTFEREGVPVFPMLKVPTPAPTHRPSLAPSAAPTAAPTTAPTMLACAAGEYVFLLYYLFFLPPFLVCDVSVCLSLSLSITTPCQHSLTPHDASLTIVPHPPSIDHQS